ncbi:CdaR family protein [Aeribacillus pallidus]|uniref:CdaR family protein n=1 Tax=Aeribacillus pallidus TaxID=33936 RepID=UPI003D2248B9
MDKLMDSRWFMRIISLILAIMLYLSVNPELEKLGTSALKQSDNTETIRGVPVEVIYDSENLVVTGVPETVDVTIEGPRSIVQSTKALKDFRIYVDLTNANIGVSQVPIKYENISDKLTVRIDPAYATVSIQERVSKEFSVEAEFNKNQLAEGFIAETPIIHPEKVTIIGAKDVIDQISYVKATIDWQGKIDETISREASILVLDHNLNKLNVIVQPKTVQVTIPVKNPSKTVPVRIKTSGELPGGAELIEVVPSVKEVTLYGYEEVLKNIDALELEVDLSKIKETTEITLPVELQKGLNKASVPNVTVNVKIDPVEKKTFENIAVKTVGLSTSYEMEYVDEGQVDLTVQGLKSQVDQLQAEDFQVYVDVSKLAVGEHEVTIKVEGPEQVIWTLSKPTLQVKIFEKQSA